MSKKKERRIKRLQRLPIWPAIVGMLFTEFVIFSLAAFICALAFFGIINTLFLDNVKECKTIVQYVNENWKEQSSSEFKKNLSEFTKSYSDVNGIFIDEHNDAIAIFPKLKEYFDDEAQELFDKVGTIHFIDPDYIDSYGNMFLMAEGDNPYDIREGSKAHDLGYIMGKNLQSVINSPIRLYHSMDFISIIKNKDFVDWAVRESVGLPVIAVYKSDIPNVNVCIKVIYKLKAFQLNLIFTDFLFFFVICLFSGVYEIVKLVNLVQRRRRVNLLVTTDTVTGGYNKDYFMQKAAKGIAKKGRQYAIVQLRLEKYRNFCTAYGLKQGENLLEDINTSLIGMLGKKEYVAHCYL